MRKALIYLYGIAISILFFIIAPIIFVIDWTVGEHDFESLKVVYKKAFNSIWEDVRLWQNRY